MTKESQRDYATLKARVGSDEINRRAREWRKANPEKVKLVLKRSRANNPGRTLWQRAKERCARSGMEFSIEQSDIVIPEFCPLLEIKLDAWGHKDVCPSLDRIDNAKGYVKGNIWIISFKANRMKNTATWEELRQFAHGILEKYKDIVNYG